MMFKINEQFKVIGKGTSLKAGAGEFILHASNSKATLLEVAKANGVKIPNKKASEQELVKIIEDSFNSNQEIPLMNDEVKTPKEKEIDPKYVQIVKEGFEQNLDADAIQVNLVKAGLKFKQAAATFKTVSEKLGFKTSSKERFDQAKAALEGFVPTDWEGVEKASKHIVANVKDTTEAQAIAILRKICKDAEKEFPKKPKGAATDGKIRGFKAIAFAWMLKNLHTATKADLKKFLTENDRGTKNSLYNSLWRTLEFGRSCAAATAKAE